MVKPYNKKLEISYCIGVYPTLELLYHHPEKVTRVLISGKGNKNIGVSIIKSICLKNGIKTEIADGTIAKITGSENCYSIGIFNKYESLIQNGNHLVLVNPSDMGNLGTIIRTALAYDVNNLAIIRPGADIFDPKVIRASMGAVFSIKFQYFDSFKEYNNNFRNNLYVYMTNGQSVLNKLSFEQPFSMIFGNEGAGLGTEYLSIGTSVIIPHTKNVDSLNLSVAVGIALYAYKTQS